MLLRASRSSEAITKEAILQTLGRIGRGLVHGATKGAKGAVGGVSGAASSAVGRAGRAVGWKAPLAVGMGTAFAAPMVSSAVQKSQAGLRPGYMAATRQRGVPSTPEWISRY